MDFEKLIGKKLEAELIEDSGAFGGTLEIKGHEFDFIVGRLEGNKTIYSTGLKPGKTRVVVKQIDTAGNYKAIYVEPDNSMNVTEVSASVKDFLVDSHRLKSFDEFREKYQNLEDCLVSTKPENDKQKELLNRFRKKYATAKSEMTQRWTKESIISEYRSSLFRLATLADSKEIEQFTTNFYKASLLNREDTPDVSAILENLKAHTDHFFISEFEGKKLGSVEYHLRIDEEYPQKPLPYLHAVGIANANPKNLRELLHGAMAHIKCPGFFTDICPTIENIDFYKEIGFRKIASFKHYSEQFKKSLPRTLIYLDPK